MMDRLELILSARLFLVLRIFPDFTRVLGDVRRRRGVRRSRGVGDGDQVCVVWRVVVVRQARFGRRVLVGSKRRRVRTLRGVTALLLDL